MKQLLLFLLTVLCAAAQAQQRPLYQTTKVEGTDGVYVFRYGGHQAMFVVTKEGVIATDPDLLRAAGGGGDLHRGDQEGLRPADQVPHL